MIRIKQLQAGPIIGAAFFMQTLLLPYSAEAAQTAQSSMLINQGVGNDAAKEQGLENRSFAVLRTLDKITARITELTVPIGEPFQLGTLSITVKYCRSRPPIEPPESFAYLTVDERPIRGNGEVVRVFDGWMVASSPGLNPLEHPVYDVWVINCKMSDGDAASSSR